jgi:Protein of unknown function (DUF1156)
VAIRKKLIEVSIPLEAINVASAREKSIRHGHPSTLHLAQRLEPIENVRIKCDEIAALRVWTTDSRVALRQCRRDRGKGGWRDRDRDHGPYWTRSST